MASKEDVDPFINPSSVAVIGASQRPGSWGSFIMEGLLSMGFPGRIYPVNKHQETVYGIEAVGDVRDIPGDVDLAVLAIPAELIEDVIKACGEKGVRGLTIITAGFGEAIEGGREREKGLASVARSYGMRILGPNVSGTFNLNARFNAAASPKDHLLATPLVAVCQGGYAFYDLLASGFSRGMGVSRFVHTGNECDLTITDFLDYFGEDPEAKGILMYVETIRDGRRFMEVARRVAAKKPVVMYKAGRTTSSRRAAMSHTGALSGSMEIYSGMLCQVGIIVSPSMELLLPLGHALIERPSMKGRRVGIVTMGGSWGVALTDALEETGLAVPEFSPGLQGRLRSLGMPVRASTKNPVDIGASGLFFSVDLLLELGREILRSSEVDALILHGLGRPGMLDDNASDEIRLFLEVEKQSMQGFNTLEKEFNVPVFIGSHFSPWESQAIHDLTMEGIRVYNRLDEIACLFAFMHQYYLIKSRGNSG